MPSKAYMRLGKNLETVVRLQGTFYDAKKVRRMEGKGRGRAAFDHITRSAIVFLVSSFEVYCEELLRECGAVQVKSVKKADELPSEVKETLEQYVLEKNQPLRLCDDGWKSVYNEIVEKEINALNTPSVRHLQRLFKILVGLPENGIESMPIDVKKLDDLIQFRGQITHKVKADKYVTIECVDEYMDCIRGLTIGMDKLLLKYMRNRYKMKKVPWKSVYKK
ncbi:MAG: hypothetical protein J6Y56_07415 [Fibrobacterales bacterium]|nr:hypothetical protein [Fibrobacterales bacterium]